MVYTNEIKYGSHVINLFEESRIAFRSQWKWVAAATAVIVVIIVYTQKNLLFIRNMCTRWVVSVHTRVVYILILLFEKCSFYLSTHWYRTWHLLSNAFPKKCGRMMKHTQKAEHTHTHFGSEKGFFCFCFCIFYIFSAISGEYFSSVTQMFAAVHSFIWQFFILVICSRRDTFKLLYVYNIKLYFAIYRQLRAIEWVFNSFLSAL